MQNNKKRPGSQPRVTTAELLEVLKPYVDKLHVNGKLFGPSQPIWKQISDAHFKIPGKDAYRFTFRDIYRQVHDNRDNIGKILLPQHIFVVTQAPKNTLVDARVHRDTYNAIDNLRDNKKYTNFIHGMDRNEFYVFYSLPNQLSAYNKYVDYMKSEKCPSVVLIDDTSDIVQEIVFNNGTKSGRIFLYAIVINFGGLSLPVHQLLSTDQSTNLLVWLIKWFKMGARKPNEIRIRYSRELFNAVSLAFNGRTTKAYADTLFFQAIVHKCRCVELSEDINTYIRINVKSFIKNIAGWDSIRTAKNSVAKNLYLCTMGLLVDAEDLKTFREILRHLFTICLHKYDDTLLEDGQLVEDSRTWLEDLVSTRSYDFTNYCDTKPSRINRNSDTDDNNAIDYEVNPLIIRYIKSIKASAKKIKTEGQKSNLFYNEDFIQQLMEIIMKEFPLWSAACLLKKNILSRETIPEIQSRKISYGEDYWDDKKSNVTSKNKKLFDVEKFLIWEFEDLQDSLKTFEKNLKTGFNKNDDSKSNDSRDVGCKNEQTVKKNHKKSLNVSESAKVNKIPSSVKSEGTSKKKEDNLLIKSTVKDASQKTIKLLINGNNRSPEILNGVKYKFRNTCGFDSILQILAVSAIDIDSYYRYIDKSSDPGIKFIQFLLNAKDIEEVYIQRAALLIARFQSKVKPPSKLEREHTLDLYSSAAEIWMTAFKDTPSAIVTSTCKVCGKHEKNLQTIIIPDHDIIHNEGYKYLTEYLEKHLAKGQSMCFKCRQSAEVKFDYNHHLYVELEIQKDLKSPLLECSLGDWDLKHEFTIDGVSYRLKGVIKHEKGHFLAYCRRENGQWEIHDDLNTEVLRVPLSESKFVPSAVIFVRNDKKKS